MITSAMPSWLRSSMPIATSPSRRLASADIT
jgi:hypothetical protein